MSYHSYSWHIASGGNFAEVLPHPDYVREGLERVPLRVHVDVVPSSQMLVEPREAVVLLPAQTRYEMVEGCTESSTERRVIFSPEISGPRIVEARLEWKVFMEMARRVRPELEDVLHYDFTPDIRADIARSMPFYEGIQALKREGDQFQYGRAQLCAEGRFPTRSPRAGISDYNRVSHVAAAGSG